jgi:hypothetical protein
MAKIEKRTKEYHYQSEMLKKGQVHLKFPDIIYRRKSFTSPFHLFTHYFRVKGDPDHQVQVLKAISRFMDALQEEKVDFNNPLSHFPLYVLESRWLMRWTAKRTLVLNKTGKQWLEALKETIEIYENEQRNPTESSK